MLLARRLPLHRAAPFVSRGYGPRASVRAMATAADTFHLSYSYVEGILDKRGPYRQDHLALIKQNTENKKILVVGLTSSPPDGAVFIWQNTSQQEVEEFAKNDPYVINGLVSNWEVKPFTIAAKSFQ